MVDLPKRRKFVGIKKDEKEKSEQKSRKTITNKKLMKSVFTQVFRSRLWTRDDLLLQTPTQRLNLLPVTGKVPNHQVIEQLTVGIHKKYERRHKHEFLTECKEGLFQVEQSQLSCKTVGDTEKHSNRGFYHCRHNSPNLDSCLKESSEECQSRYNYDQKPKKNNKNPLVTKHFRIDLW